MHMPAQSAPQKMEGKELDKVKAKWEEVQLRIYEKSVMDHHQLLTGYGKRRLFEQEEGVSS